ncbi:MAG: hypothetical protein KGZ49_11535 [Syntrophaceae bacterium]|nr:hypothetical protein [Syntrophaceae bacterium]
MGNVAFALKNINHPPVVGSYRLDKIFGDMTARWTDFPPASVTHYSRGVKRLRGEAEANPEIPRLARNMLRNPAV